MPLTAHDPIEAGGQAALQAILQKLLKPTGCWSNPEIVIGTSSTTKIKFTNRVQFTIAGVVGTPVAAATETAFTTTTHNITANASSVQEAVYLVTVVAGGTVTITKGTTATGAGNAVIPDPPASSAVVGYVRVAVAAGATNFAANSDALSAGHLTVTYTNVLGIWDAGF